ncbi:MAG: S9 family peptidase, partial [Bacteroidetes bacterium]|nr:S9 family peptidase [Bacteroidota bacterium]
MNRKSLLVVCLILLIASTSFSQEKRNFTIEELFKYTRVSDPQISPDSKWIAYVVNIIDKEKNRGNSDIWIIASTGGTPRKLTTS